MRAVSRLMAMVVAGTLLGTGCQVTNPAGNDGDDPNNPAGDPNTPSADTDRDQDGLSDAAEADLGTDPDDADTDDDSLADGFEVDLGLDPTQAELVLRVAEAVCATLLQLDDGTIYQSQTANAFADWSASDPVVFAGETGELVNLALDEGVAAERFGDFEFTALLRQKSSLVSTVLLDGGALFVYDDPSRETVSEWREDGDEIYVLRDADGSRYTLINLRNCSAVPADLE